jgi:hypothetical protein
MSYKRRVRGRRKKSFAFIDQAFVSALAQNESPLGMILSSLPDWMLRAADRWAQQDVDFRAKQKGPREGYLPLPDPWRYLLEVPSISASTKKTLRAAQSWLVGLRKLCHMAEGCGTLRTDWYEEAAKARAKGNKRRESYFLAKIAGRVGLFKRIQRDLQAEGKLSEEAAVWCAKRQAQLKRRSVWQRAKADFEPMLRLEEIEKNFPFEYYLIESWLCFPSGPWPGLMFWSNEAMTKWLFARMEKPRTSYGNLGRDRVKKTRQRLGLLQVDAKSPVVWDVTIHRFANGGLTVKGHDRKGCLVFSGEFRRRA